MPDTTTRTATFIRRLPQMFDAWLVRFDPPLTYFDSGKFYGIDDNDAAWDTYGEHNAVTEYAAVSIGRGFSAGRVETNAFPCGECGHVSVGHGILALNGRVDDDFADFAEIVSWVGYQAQGLDGAS